MANALRKTAACQTDLDGAARLSMLYQQLMNPCRTACPWPGVCRLGSIEGYSRPRRCNSRANVCPAAGGNLRIAIRCNHLGVDSRVSQKVVGEEDGQEVTDTRIERNGASEASSARQDTNGGW